MHQWIPGIKVGPNGEWQDHLERSGATMCEIWYRVDWEDKYTKLFQYLENHQIQAGMHFWGVLEGNVMPNLAYPDKQIWEPTLALMKQNIDVAAKHRFQYVNIHLGNAALEKRDFDQSTIEAVPGSEVEITRAEHTFTEHIQTLHTYAQERQVMLIIETIPPFDAEHYRDNSGRMHPHSTHALGSVYLENIAKHFTLNVNNDFCHTACEAAPSEDREKIWQYLWNRTIALAPYTKLIHATTMQPPFNGTDSHDGILDEDFTQHNLFPSREQFIQLLNVFKDRSDVWVVNEPHTHHVENFQTLSAISNAV